MSSSTQSQFLEYLKSLKLKDLPNIEAIAQPRIDVSVFERGRRHTWNNRGLLKQPDQVSRGAYLASEHFAIMLCAGKALDRYGYPLLVEIHFKSDEDQTSINHAISFFRGLGIRDAVLDTAIEFLSKRQRLNNIYINAELADPNGHFWINLGIPIDLSTPRP
ncbi:hypothetical protein NOF04DRAFT_1268036 [Fusarium oxysporum II5]|nr:hypothetical protein NOF04DRAFT_1268036 [Fusarium oxysporum II5]